MQRINTFEMARYGADLQRRMHDMPIGDPLSGAPYGEYLKSKALGMVLGVVASVVTMGAAAPLLASTVLATQIAGGVMMAGGVLSGVGAVTGNKKLAKIGGIMSLAGGIGAAASGLTGGLGLGGAGSGSEAISNMANSFMDSASSMTGGLAYGERVAGAAAETAAGDFATGAEATSTPVVDAQAQVEMGELPLDATTTAGSQIDPANISNGPPGVTDTTGGATANPVADPQAQVTTGGQLDLKQTPTTGGSQIDPANITNEAPAAWKAGLATEDKGIFAKANSFIGDNKELLKTGASALEMGMKYGMDGDKANAEIAYYNAAAAKSGAEASLLKTKEDELKWQQANQKKKSIMLSASDPQLEQKMAQAAAEGVVVGVIPNFGAGGITQNSNNPYGNAANMAGTQGAQGQQVVRQATFTAPAPQQVQPGLLARNA